MISIGTNEGVVLSSVGFNEKGTLEVAFKETDAQVKQVVKKSALELLSDGSDDGGSTSTGEAKFLFFVPDAKKFDNPNENRDTKDIFQSIVDIKAVYSHILLQFLPKDQVKFAPFAGVADVDLTKEQAIYDSMIREEVRVKVVENLGKNFIAQVTPFLNHAGNPLRLLLVRRKKEASYADLRKKYLDNQPFLERINMVPIEKSLLWIDASKPKTTKLHEPFEHNGVKYVPNFTEYEIKNGKDDPRRVEGTADAPETTGEMEGAGIVFSAGAIGQPSTPAPSPNTGEVPKFNFSPDA